MLILLLVLGTLIASPALRQDQLAELRMKMMHMQGKKKEQLVHDIANCPKDEVLRNRFKAELLSGAIL